MALANENFGFDSITFNLTEEDLNDTKIRAVLETVLLGSDSMTNGITESILITVYSILSIAAILSNSVILFVIVKTKKLWVPTHLLLMNLMVADIALAAVCMPFTLITFIRKSWPFGWLSCKIIPSIQAISVFSTSITIAIIAADRWYRITSSRPLVINNNHSCSFSKTKLILEVSLIWFASIGLSVPHAYFQEIIQIGIPGYFSYPKCVENWPHRSRGFYALSILFVQLIFPSVCLFLSFIKIRSHLRANLDRVVQRNRSPSNESAVGGERSSSDGKSGNQQGGMKKMMFSTIKRGDSNESGILTLEQAIEDDVPSPMMEEGAKWNTGDRHHTRILKEMDRNRRVTNTLLYVLGEFIFCWCPWNAINIYLDFNPDAPNHFSQEVLHGLLACCHVIAMSSSTINALLYGYTNSNIRRELKRLWSNDHTQH